MLSHPRRGRTARIERERPQLSLRELAAVIKNVYSGFVKSSELKRWLAKQGVTFGTQKGSHLKLFLNGRQSILPIHGRDLPKSLVEDIKKQLGLKDKE